jgi:crotonobetainyl-CoA:carnitine CoA-transferase CaiB-like acyl-CoA transferase
MLSDLGAEVVKVEPPDGDITRRWGEVREGLSGFYTQQNAGKQNICVDLKADGGADLVGRLASAADVVIENFRPGVLDRLGLGWPVLQAANPGLVMLSITGFGQDGPERDRQAYAPVIHAESGLIARQAAFDGAWPSDPMLSVADTNAGLHGLVAILAALLQREVTGQGQHIDMAMADAMLATDDYAHHAIDGFPIRRLGGDVWEATGGPILIAGGPRNLWHQLHTVHQLEDPTPPDADLEEKGAVREAACLAWMAAFTDRDELKAALAAADLAWAEPRDPMTAFASPTARHRGMRAEVDDGAGGTRGVVQSPYRMSGSTTGVRGGAPHRGQHNEAVLMSWLGIGPDEIATLVADGVLLAG